jgi:NADPH:quinone reductase-like Zn-dependent oxidoreductase|tara:strand:- start:1934 stop:3229 length:1296 start_codon:yes stop_codon:yes gene_type:complete
VTPVVAVVPFRLLLLVLTAVCFFGAFLFSYWGALLFDHEMRAAVYDRSCVEGIKVVTNRPLPSPSQTALLVRVKACAVNPVDAKGVIGDKLPPVFAKFARRMIDGQGVGFDLSGVVEHAPLNSGFQVGDEVFGAVPPFRGALAELVSVPLDQICLKPTTLTHAQAAALVLPGVTCAQLLRQFRFREGERVLVIGASGGVGHLLVQMLRWRNAGQVVGVCSAKNASFVKRLGADHVVAYDAPSGSNADVVVDALRAVVVANKKPFDLVIDCVTSHDTRDAGNQYESRVRSAEKAGVAKETADGSGVGIHNGTESSSIHEKHRTTTPGGVYVTIGGSFSRWVIAGLKRVFGVNLFPTKSELFWIKFSGCAKDLTMLATMAEFEQRAGDGVGVVTVAAVTPTIAATHALTNAGVRDAFKQMHERRVVGKIVVTP